MVAGDRQVTVSWDQPSGAEQIFIRWSATPGVWQSRINRASPALRCNRDFPGGYRVAATAGSYVITKTYAPPRDHLGLATGTALENGTQVTVQVGEGPGCSPSRRAGSDREGRWKLFRVTPTSTDASLSALTAAGSRDGSDFSTAVPLSPAFAAATLTYAATVANAVTHVKLTPTVTESSATVKVGKTGSLTAVRSGEASAAIALDVGANEIKVEVTKQDGKAKTYTVTVTRKKPVLVLSPTTTTRVYGATEPSAYEYTVEAKSGSAFVAGDTASTTFFTSSPLQRESGDDVGEYAFSLVSSPSYATGMEALYTFEVAAGAKYTITKKALTIGGSVVLTKVYDGDADAAGATVKSGGAVSGEAGSESFTLAVSGGTYPQSDVGTGLTIASPTFTLTPGSAASKTTNYSYTLPAAATGEITAKEVTVASAVLSKEYDGGTGISGATLSGGEVSGEAGSESLTLQVTGGSYASADVGTGITINDAEFGLEAGADTDKDNYRLPSSITLTGTITKKALTIGGSVVLTKVYDGDADAAGATVKSGGAVTGEVGSESFTLAVSGGTYPQSDVGAGLTIASPTFTLTPGSAASKPTNYEYTLPSAATGEITAAAITDIDGVTVVSRPVDGTTTATFDTTAATGAGVVTAELAGFRAGLTVSGTFPEGAKTTADTYNVAVTYSLGDSGAFDASNYTLGDSGDTLSGTVTDKRVLVLTPTTTTRVYGQTEPSAYEYTVEAKSGSAFASGHSASTTFFTSSPLRRESGDDVGEYAFSLVSSPSYATGMEALYTFEVASGAKYTITKKALTIGGSVVLTKEYDGGTGTTGASVKSGGAVTGEVGAESFTLAVSGGTYPQSDVGAGLTIASPTFTLSASGGAKTGNYRYTLPSAATGAIAPRQVTVAPAVLTRRYDGTAAIAGAVLSGGAVGRVVRGQSLTLRVTGGAYASGDVGDGIAIVDPTFELVAGAGTKAANYRLPARIALTGTITAWVPFFNSYRISGATAAEGSNAELTIRLNHNAPARGLQFTVTPTFTTGVGAASAADTGPVPRTVTVAGGARTATLSIPIVRDADVDPGETFAVTIAPFNLNSLDRWLPAVYGADTATVTIDPPFGNRASFSLAEALLGVTAVEGATAELTVRLSENAPPGGLRLIVTPTFTSGVGKAAAADVGVVPRTVTVPAYARTATLAIPIARDDRREPDETFTVLIRLNINDPLYGIWVDGPEHVVTATVTIADEGLETLSFARAAVRVVEGTGAPLTVTRSGVTTEAVAFETVAAPGATATTADFAAGTRSHTIAAGAAATTFTIATTQNALNDRQRQFTVTIRVAADTGYRAGRRATVTILDDEYRLLVLTPTTTGREYGARAPAEYRYTVEPWPGNGFAPGDDASTTFFTSNPLTRERGDDVGEYAFHLVDEPSYAAGMKETYGFVVAAGAKYTITKKALTIGGSVVLTKVYDGDADASGATVKSGGAVTGEVGAESFTLAVSGGTYPQSDVGAGLTIASPTFTLTPGSAASKPTNYEYTLPSAATGEITAATITDIDGVTVVSRPVDGTTTAEFVTTQATGAGVVTAELAGFRAGLTVSGTFPEEAKTTADTYSVEVTYSLGDSGAFDASNYTLGDSGDTLSGTVTTKRVLVLSPTTTTRVYGATEPSAYEYTVEVKAGSAFASGHSASTTFFSSNPLQRESGDDVGEYAFSLVSSPSYAAGMEALYTFEVAAGAKYTITKKALSISTPVVLTKEYDGDADAAGASVKSGGAVSGEVGSESFTLAVSGGTYPQSDVGAGLTIASPAFTLAAGSAASKPTNYEYTLPSAATGEITATAITDIDGVTVVSRPVDGTTTATFDKTAATGAGVVTAELAGFRGGLTVSGTFPEEAKTTADTYSVEVTYTLGDSGSFDASNYTLSDAGDTLSGTVTAKPVLVLSPTTTTRVYGQTEPSAYEYTVEAKAGSAFASGHSASTTFFRSNPLQRESGDDVGEYAFSLVSSPSYAAGMAALYTFEVAAGATYTITKKALTIGGSVVLTKVYDGDTDAAGATVKSGGAVTGEVGSESFTLAVSGGTYPQSDVGMGLTIASPTFTLSASGGAKTGNYSYTLPSAATGEITAVAITDIDGVTVVSRPVDGTTTATFDKTAATGAGVVTAELAGFRGGLTVSGTFPEGAKTTAGAYNVAVTYSLGDSGAFDASNYTLGDSGDTLSGTVTAKRVLVLTPTTTTREYGQTEPTAYEYTVEAKSGSAFASGHSASTTFFTSSPLQRASGDDVGEYAFSLVSSPSYAAGMAALYTFEVASGATYTITKKALTIGGSVVLTKVYDGTAAASGATVKSGGAVSGEVGAESFTLAVSGGTYPQSDVGAGLTIASPAFTLTPGNAQSKTTNYSYTLPSAATGEITAAAITDIDGVTVVSRPVDGTTTATFDTTAATGAGVVTAELAGFRAGLTVSGTFPEAAKTTADTYSVAVTYELGDSGAFDASNYTLGDSGDTLPGTVTAKRVLVLSPTTTTREYGATEPTAYEYTVEVKAGSAFASGHSASTTFFTSSPLRRESGDDVGEYAFSLVSSPSYATGMEALYTFEVASGATYTITKKALTIGGAVVLTKVYDGGTSTSGASVKSGGAVSGEAGSESFTLAVSGGTYPQSDVGAGLTIASPTFTLAAGSAASKPTNYEYTLPSAATGEITAAAITDIDGVTVVSRPVDGTTAATFDTTAATGAGVVTAELAGFRAGLTVSGTFPEAAKTTPGDYSVEVTYELGDSGAFDASNYTLSDAGDTLSGTVTAKRVLVLTPTTTTREYGATEPSAYEYTVEAKAGSAFASGHSASTTFFTSSPLQRASGDDVGEYAFSLVASPAYATGMAALYTFEVVAGAKYTITAKALTIGGSVVLTKVYDGGTGTTGASVKSGGAVNGEAGLESFTLAVSGGTYPQSDVGMGLTIASPTFTLSASGGAKTSNYSYTLPSAATGDITKKATTYTGTAGSRGYDGTTTVSTTISGSFNPALVSGDTVTVSGGSYAQADVGTNIAINGSTVSGADAGNYDVTTSITGTITKQALSIATPVVLTKVYDGTTGTTGASVKSGGAVTGEAGSESFTLAVSGGTYPQSDVGVGLTIASPAFTLSASGGAKTSNYRYTLPSAATGEITKKATTYTGTAAAREYDGTDTVRTRYSGSFQPPLITGDVVTVSGGRYAAADAGAGIVISDAVVGGAPTGNYAVTTSVMGTITKKELTIAVPVVLTKVYDGGTGTSGATVKSGGAVSGEAGSESFTLAVSGGTYPQSAVGTGLTIASPTFTLTPGNAQSKTTNYSYTLPSAATGEITAAAITDIDGVTVVSRRVDGTTAAEFVTTQATGAGVVTTELAGFRAGLTVSGTFPEGAKTTAGDYSVAVTYTLGDSGAFDASNYTLGDAGDTLSGTVTAKRVLVLSPTTTTRVYGATEPSAYEYTVEAKAAARLRAGTARARRSSAAARCSGRAATTPGSTRSAW